MITPCKQCALQFCAFNICAVSYVVFGVGVCWSGFSLVFKSIRRVSCPPAVFGANILMRALWGTCTSSVLLLLLLLLPFEYLTMLCRTTGNPRNQSPENQITLSNMIDADWTIGRERADVAGKILADALLNREQVRRRSLIQQVVGRMSVDDAPLPRPGSLPTIFLHHFRNTRSLALLSPNIGYLLCVQSLFSHKCPAGVD